MKGIPFIWPVGKGLVKVCWNNLVIQKEDVWETKIAMEIDLFATYIWPNGGVSSQQNLSLPNMYLFWSLRNREIHKSPP